MATSLIHGGELVWCRVPGFPWWPAISFESTDDINSLDLDPPPGLGILTCDEIVVLFLYTNNYQKGPRDDLNFVRRFYATKILHFAV
jgi:hypothetical protein